MGIAEYVKWYAGYGTHAVKNGKYTHFPKGSLKEIRKPIGGAVAE